MLYGVAAVATVAAMLWSRLERDRWHVEVGVLALAGFLGLSYTTIVLNVQQRTSNDPSQQIADLRALVTAEGRFVSFGPVHHLFAYYFGETIEYQPLNKQMAPGDCDAEYFCFAEDPGFPTAQVPFPWERVAEISCERARSAQPRAKVIVGRRIVLSAAAPADKRPLPPSRHPSTNRSSHQWRVDATFTAGFSSPGPPLGSNLLPPIARRIPSGRHS